METANFLHYALIPKPPTMNLLLFVSELSWGQHWISRPAQKFESHFKFRLCLGLKWQTAWQSTWERQHCQKTVSLQLKNARFSTKHSVLHSCAANLLFRNRLFFTLCSYCILLHLQTKQLSTPQIMENNEQFLCYEFSVFCQWTALASSKCQWGTGR